MGSVCNEEKLVLQWAIAHWNSDHFESWGGAMEFEKLEYILPEVFRQDVPILLLSGSGRR